MHIIIIKTTTKNIIKKEREREKYMAEKWREKRKRDRRNTWWKKMVGKREREWAPDLYCVLKSWYPVFQKLLKVIKQQEKIKTGGGAYIKWESF